MLGGTVKTFAELLEETRTADEQPVNIQPMHLLDVLPAPSDLRFSFFKSRADKRHGEDLLHGM
eukprot:1776230-Karenia_brevis.AAC.1